jgi:hypothetical protein
MIFHSPCLLSKISPLFDDLTSESPMSGVTTDKLRRETDCVGLLLIDTFIIVLYSQSKRCKEQWADNRVMFVGLIFSFFEAVVSQRRTVRSNSNCVVYILSVSFCQMNINYAAELCTSCTISEILSAQRAQMQGKAI